MLVRSYSRNFGDIFDDSDTGNAGARSLSRAAAVRSCAGFEYACRNETATDSASLATTASIAASSEAGSMGISTAPSGPTRSTTSKVRRRGTSGGGFVMYRS